MTAHVSNLWEGCAVQHTGAMYEGKTGGLFDRAPEGQRGIVVSGTLGRVKSISNDWREVVVEFSETFAQENPTAVLAYESDSRFNIADLRRL